MGFVWTYFIAGNLSVPIDTRTFVQRTHAFAYLPVSQRSERTVACGRKCLWSWMATTSQATTTTPTTKPRHRRGMWAGTMCCFGVLFGVMQCKVVAIAHIHRKYTRTRISHTAGLWLIYIHVMRAFVSFESWTIIPATRICVVCCCRRRLMREKCVIYFRVNINRILMPITDL